MAREPEDIKEYNEEQQKLLVSVLMSSDAIFSRCQNILNAKYFVNKLRPAMRFILKHVEDYRVLPKFEQLNAATGLGFSPIENISLQHQDSFLDEIEEFCKNRALADAVLTAVELIEQGNYGEVEKRVREAILISLQSDIGTDYFSNPRERLLKIKNNNGQVSTGWKSVDEKLYGGVNRGEITIWCAGSGVGKSLFLQNIAINFAKQGLNVVYISLELSEELCAMRMDSMISGVGTKEVFRKLDEVEIRVKQTGNKSGSMHVKQMPQGSTCNDIKAYLKNYEIETGKRPDALVIDYLDLLFPNNKKIDPSNLFVKDKYITEELRGLMVERKMIGQTAAQLNRCLAVDTVVYDNNKNEMLLSNVIVGDQIVGPNGLVTVTGISNQKSQAMYRIKTKNGNEIVCSASHRFPTVTGLQSLEEGLACGDRLYQAVHI